MMKLSLNKTLIIKNDKSKSESENTDIRIKKSPIYRADARAAGLDLSGPEQK